MDLASDGAATYNCGEARKLRVQEVPVESMRRVRKADLARHAGRVIQAVRKGEPALVESDGEPEVAIIDVVDYRLLRAALRHLGRPVGRDAAPVGPGPAPAEGGLDRQEVDALPDVQARYDLVLARYLQGDISLARAAELLDMPWIELRTRFRRLDIPVATAPADLAEALQDVEVAMRLARPEP